MAQALIGIVDIGKTHTRFLLVDARSGLVISQIRRPSYAAPGPVRQLDILGTERWLLATLAAVPQKAHIRALVPIAHGASCALLDTAQRVLIAPDYEDPAFDSVAEAYRPLRDPYEATYSPFLPLGLNLGRQLYYLETQIPGLFVHARRLLLYPQYWAWRLSGVTASELTSLGCHTDLWRPLEARPSMLAGRRGWQALLPPLYKADDCLGTISPTIVAETGLAPDCKVACGIHDSNAAFLSHLIHRSREKPFAVVSSDTWTVIMAYGVDFTRLREPLDMLLNIDAFGRPIATARFMGGREYETIAGVNAIGVKAEHNDVQAVIEKRALALPSFASAGGPFAQQPGRLIAAQDLSTRQRAALATLYMALMTDYLLEFFDVRGEVIIDGPIADNVLYTELLASLRPGNRILVGKASESAAVAGCYLAGFTDVAAPQERAVGPIAIPGLSDYREAWRGEVLQHQSASDA